ncbi:Uncharacterised protein [Vibrio cholerae]|nr:Uncharacterised protein [Vibrio cholerae]
MPSGCTHRADAIYHSDGFVCLGTSKCHLSVSYDGNPPPANQCSVKCRGVPLLAHFLGRI